MVEDIKKSLLKSLLKKIRKGAELTVRKDYQYIFDDEEKIYNIPFSLNKYAKLGKYETLQLEVSINGKGVVIASLQSKKGKENLEKLFNLIRIYKKIKTTINVLGEIENIKKEIKHTKFKEEKK